MIMRLKPGKQKPLHKLPKMPLNYRQWPLKMQ